LEDKLDFALLKNSNLILGPIGFFVFTFRIFTLRDTETFSSVSKEFDHIMACVMNVGLIGLSTYVKRSLLMVQGLLGVLAYIIYLGFSFLKDS